MKISSRVTCTHWPRNSISYFRHSQNTQSSISLSRTKISHPFLTRLSMHRLSDSVCCRLWEISCLQKQGVQMSHSKTSNIVPTEDALSHLMDTLGGNEVQVHELPTKFDLIHWLDFLPRLHADALGLQGVAALYMHIHLPSPISYGGQYRPAVQISVGKKKPTFGEQRTEPHDKAVYQVSKICEAYIAENWPCQTKRDTIAFLKDLYRHIQCRISQLGNFCVVCGLQQQQNGLKPVPCDSEACNFAFDELGIGAGLTDIYSRPATADLLISMASAACQCTGRRDDMFRCLPSDLLTVNNKKGKDSNSRHSIDWNRMGQAFQGLPSVALMAKQPHLHHFFLGKDSDRDSERTEHELSRVGTEHMDLKDGDVQFRLLRSVLNSCRGHLMQLEEADKFPMMETEHQFRLCTDSPAKEAIFAELKADQGSQFLFHGSAFHNWHCIIREGLKNMSNTKMMSAGAARGSGIYFADHSSTSIHYCGYASIGYTAYANSIFGSSPQCIALCEVINDSFNKETTGSRGNGIRVVPDAENVITRYLFVYSGTQIPAVKASVLGAICDKHAKHQEDVVTNLQAVTENIEQPIANSLLTPAKAPAKTNTALWPVNTQEDSEDEDVDMSEASEPNSSEYGFEFSYADSDGDEVTYTDSRPVEKSAEELSAAIAERKANEELDAKFASAVSSGTQKRLLQELKELKKSNTRSEGFEIEVVDDDLSLWEAKIWCDTDCSLGKDLQVFQKHHGRDYVTMRLRFGDDYPNQPPFVWVVSPIFKPQTGFVSRGAVCTTMLLNTGTSAAWSPVYTAEDVVRQIRANFQLADAGGRINNVSLDQSYTEEQARAGWTHAKSMHRWWISWKYETLENQKFEEVQNMRWLANYYRTSTVS